MQGVNVSASEVLLFRGKVRQMFGVACVSHCCRCLPERIVAFIAPSRSSCPPLSPQPISAATGIVAQMQIIVPSDKWASSTPLHPTLSGYRPAVEPTGGL